MKKRIVLFLVFTVTLVTLFVACQKTSTVSPTTDTQDATDTAPVIPEEEYPIPTQEQLDALTDADWAILDEMTEGGFISFAQAFQILQVDKIVDKLEAHGQMITYLDDQIVVVPAEDGTNYLTDEETEYIIRVLSEEENKLKTEETISREEAMEILQKEIEEHPEQGTWSIDCGAGHILVITGKDIPIEE